MSVEEQIETRVKKGRGNQVDPTDGGGVAAFPSTDRNIIHLVYVYVYLGACPLGYHTHQLSNEVKVPVASIYTPLQDPGGGHSCPET